MPIRLRLALAFAAATAIAFALGSWLFIRALSAAQLATIDSQLAVQLTQAARYLPTGHRVASAAVSPVPGEYAVQVIDSGNHVRGASEGQVAGNHWDDARGKRHATEKDIWRGAKQH